MYDHLVITVGVYVHVCHWGAQGLLVFKKIKNKKGLLVVPTVLGVKICVLALI